MISEFKLVAITKPLTIACWTDEQHTFFPEVQMGLKEFESLYKYCKDDWDEEKLAVVEYDEEINGIPVNSVLKEIKLL